MTEGVASYGARGQAIQKNAEALHKKGLLTDTEFKELTNDTFSQRDFAAVNAAMERTKNFTDLGATQRLNSDVIALRPSMKKAVDEKQQTLGQAFGALLRVMMQ